MLRFIIGITFLVFYYILSWPFFIIERVIRFFNPTLASKIGMLGAKNVVKFLVFICNINLIINGKEKIPTDKPVLFISNHEGFFDIVVTLAQLPTPTGFIAKQSALKVPLIHGWGSRIHCLGLDRTDIRQGLKVILSAIDEINSGHSMFIYPEGTRSKGKGFGEFKPGSFKVATKTGCPIVPVAVTGTYSIFEAQMPRVNPGDVYLTFGDPIYINELSDENKKHIAEYVHDIIDDMLKEHQQQR